RIMAHRAHLLGWGTKEHAARISITDKADTGDRELKVEFILPSKRITDMADDHHTYHHDHRQSIDTPLSPPSPPPLRITPRHDDLILDKVQPSAFKKPRGGFDWS